jgi:hypothetical protein
VDFSWVLATVGVTGMVIAGRKIWWGWLFNLANEILWVIFAVITKQYGFILMAIGYSAVYANNARNWKHDVDTANQRSDGNHRRNAPVLRVTCVADVPPPTRTDRPTS